MLSTHLVVSNHLVPNQKSQTQPIFEEIGEQEKLKKPSSKLETIFTI